MIKQFSGIVLALSVAGLAGCGMMPNGTHGTPGSTLAVATVGQHGATVTLDFGRSLATQAVHRWVTGDIVRYDVILKEMTNDGSGVVRVFETTEVDKNKSGVKFSGLSFGKKYHAYVQIKGNEGGDPTKTLEMLNKDSQDDNGVGYVVFNFTAKQNINDNQSKTIKLRFDDVVFNGKGDLTIKGPKDGNYTDDPEGPKVDDEPLDEEE